MLFYAVTLIHHTWIVFFSPFPLFTVATQWKIYSKIRRFGTLGIVAVYFVFTARRMYRKMSELFVFFKYSQLRGILANETQKYQIFVFLRSFWLLVHVYVRRFSFGIYGLISWVMTDMTLLSNSLASRKLRDAHKTKFCIIEAGLQHYYM